MPAGKCFLFPVRMECLSYGSLTMGLRGRSCNRPSRILRCQLVDRSRVISLDSIQRSVSVRIEGYDLEVL